MAVVLVPGVAHAKPPSNDDFDNSTAITALPYTVQQDTSEASKAPDDPYGCDGYNHDNSVWFSYTAAESGLLRATAGVTYHFMVSGFRGSVGGQLSFAVNTIAPAANDNFAAAERITARPFTQNPDLTTASVEADEHQPSVWYSYTTSGQARSLTARIEGDSLHSVVAVYTRNSLPELRETTCHRPQGDGPAVFRANPDTTYYFRVVSRHGDSVRFTFDEAPALQPQIYTSSEATIYDKVRFEPTSWQAIDRPLSGEWDFGDGTTAPRTTGAVEHRYTADGVYKVTLRAASPDGRTGTVSREITVKTHDVSIERFEVPDKARAGVSKQIRVHVANTRYAERVTVKLHKNSGSSWTDVGELTIEVPAHPDNTVRFPFSYTFTPEDAVAGKVTFRAVAQLTYPVQDALQLDNEAISLATKVRPMACF